MDSNFKVAKATKTSPLRPCQSGARILVTSKRSPSQILCGHLKGISFSFGCQEPDVLFWRANAKGYPRSTGPHRWPRSLLLTDPHLGVVRLWLLLLHICTVFFKGIIISIRKAQQLQGRNWTREATAVSTARQTKGIPYPDSPAPLDPTAHHTPWLSQR